MNAMLIGMGSRTTATSSAGKQKLGEELEKSAIKMEQIWQLFRTRKKMILFLASYHHVGILKYIALVSFKKMKERKRRGIFLFVCLISFLTSFSATGLSRDLIPRLMCGNFMCCRKET